jgi:hypothetical protein
MTSADRGTATISGLKSLEYVTVLSDGSYLCNADVGCVSLASWLEEGRLGAVGLEDVRADDEDGAGMAGCVRGYLCFTEVGR